MKENFEPQKNTTEGKKEATGGTMAQIKKALVAGIFGVTSALPAKGQDAHYVSMSNEKKSKIESPMPKPVGDAKQLEIGLYNEKDSIKIINIANYYETDKADISPENINEISKSVNEYLSNLNHDNLESFLKSNIILRVSCDPRPTNYEGVNGKVGNLTLAEDRARTAVLAIKYSLSNFSNKNLNSVEITAVIEKFNGIKIEIPMTATLTGKGEDGVVDYHNMINPETNKPYTDADWEELQKPENEEKKLKIYESFRYANLSLIIPNMHPEDSIPNPEKPPFDLSGYEKAYLLFDVSPSMKDWKEYIADKVAENKTDIPIEVSGFTSKIDTTFNAKNVHEAAEVLKNIKLVDDPDEFALNGIIVKLQNINETGKKDTHLQQQKKIIVACSDEYLQSINKEKLDTIKKLAEQNNVTVQFSLVVREWHKETNEEWKEVREFTLDDIDKAYDNIYKETLKEKVENYQKNLKLTQRDLTENFDALGKVNNQKDKKRIMKTISELQDDLERYTAAVQNAQTISLGNFAAKIAKPEVENVSVKPDRFTTVLESKSNNAPQNPEAVSDISVKTLKGMADGVKQYLLNFNQDNFKLLIDSMSINLHFNYTNTDSNTSEDIASKEAHNKNIQAKIGETIRNAVDQIDLSQNGLTPAQITEIKTKYKKLLEDPQAIVVNGSSSGSR